MKYLETRLSGQPDAQIYFEMIQDVLPLVAIPTDLTMGILGALFIDRLVRKKKYSITTYSNWHNNTNT